MTDKTNDAVSVDFAATATAMDPIYRQELLSIIAERLRHERALEHSVAEELARCVTLVQAFEALEAAMRDGRNLKGFAARVVEVTAPPSRFDAFREDANPAVRKRRVAALAQLIAELTLSSHDDHASGIALTAAAMADRQDIA